MKQIFAYLPFPHTKNVYRTFGDSSMHRLVESGVSPMTRPERVTTLAESQRQLDGVTENAMARIHHHPAMTRMRNQNLTVLGRESSMNVLFGIGTTSQVRRAIEASPGYMADAEAGTRDPYGRIRNNFRIAADAEVAARQMRGRQLNAEASLTLAEDYAGAGIRAARNLQTEHAQLARIQQTHYQTRSLGAKIGWGIVGLAPGTRHRISSNLGQWHLKRNTDKRAKRIGAMKELGQIEVTKVLNNIQELLKTLNRAGNLGADTQLQNAIQIIQQVHDTGNVPGNFRAVFNLPPQVSEEQFAHALMQGGYIDHVAQGRDAQALSQKMDVIQDRTLQQIAEFETEIELMDIEAIRGSLEGQGVEPASETPNLAHLNDALFAALSITPPAGTHAEDVILGGLERNHLPPQAEFMYLMRYLNNNHPLIESVRDVDAKRMLLRYINDADASNMAKWDADVLTEEGGRRHIAIFTSHVQDMFTKLEAFESRVNNSATGVANSIQAMDPTNFMEIVGMGVALIFEHERYWDRFKEYAQKKLPAQNYNQLELDWMDLHAMKAEVERCLTNWAGEDYKKATTGEGIRGERGAFEERYRLTGTLSSNVAPALSDLDDDTDAIEDILDRISGGGGITTWTDEAKKEAVEQAKEIMKRRWKVRETGRSPLPRVTKLNFILDAGEVTARLNRLNQQLAELPDGSRSPDINTRLRNQLATDFYREVTDRFAVEHKLNFMGEGKNKKGNEGGIYGKLKALAQKTERGGLRLANIRYVTKTARRQGSKEQHPINPATDLHMQLQINGLRCRGIDAEGRITFISDAENKIVVVAPYDGKNPNMAVYLMPGPTGADFDATTMEPNHMGIVTNALTA